jgi:competence protein ComGC
MIEDRKIKKSFTLVEKVAIAFIIILIIIILFLIFYQDVIEYIEEFKVWYENEAFTSS